MRGPGSSLYGADAIGGVVNIVTRRGEGAPYVSGNVAGGNYRSGEASVALSGSQSSYDYALSLSGETSDGVSAIRPGDEFGQYNPDDDGFSRAGCSWPAASPGRRASASAPATAPAGCARSSTARSTRRRTSCPTPRRTFAAG